MLCKGKGISSLINRVTLPQYCRARVGRGNQTTKAPISVLGSDMNDQSLRPGKAKQLHLKTTPFFPREKKSCLRHVCMYIFLRLASLGGGPQAHVHMKGMKCRVLYLNVLAERVCSVFVNLRPHLLRIHSRHQFT